MNLWTFVLLGFLAHSCSGQIAVRHDMFTKYACSIITSHIAKYESCSLAPFDLPAIGEVNTTVAGLKLLKIVFTYEHEDTYRLGMTGRITLDSPQVAELVLDVNVNVPLRLVVDGCPCLILQDSLLLLTQVITKITPKIGNLLGGLQSPLDTFKSTLQNLFQEKAKEMVQTGIDSLNSKSKSFTEPVNRNGYWHIWNAFNITFNKDSFLLSISLVIKDPAKEEFKTLSFGNNKLTKMPDGASSIIWISKDFISKYIESQIDSVAGNFKKIIPSSELNQYGLQVTDGRDVFVTVERSSTTSSRITASELSISLSVEIQFTDADMVLLKINVGINTMIDVTRRNSELKFSTGDASITKPQISGIHERLTGSDNIRYGNILNILKKIIEDILNGLKSELGTGMPSIDKITPYLPPDSKCSPSVETGMIQCVCKEAAAEEEEEVAAEEEEEAAAEEEEEAAAEEEEEAAAEKEEEAAAE